MPAFYAGAMHAEPILSAAPAPRALLIREHAGWNKDCEAIALPPIYLFNAPHHGKICARPQEIKITSMVLGTEGQCIGRMVRGVRLIYQPDGNFAGEDNLLYAIQYPSALRQVAVTVTVTADPAASNSSLSEVIEPSSPAARAPLPVPPCAEMLF